MSSGLTSEKFPLLLFIDGDCAFCNRWAYRLKQADRTRHIRYGTLQGPTFQRLAQERPDLAKADSVVLVARRGDGEENFLLRSSAIREVIRGVPGFGFFELILTVAPRPLSDLGYTIFARLRTTLFGRWSHCRRPLEEDPELFLD